MAEVLITLGVIGVVAAMTIPTLAKNYYKHTVEVQLAKTYSELANAIKLSEIENGSFKYWDYPVTFSSASSNEFAERYILPYLTKSFKKGNFKKTISGPVAAYIFTLADGKTMLISARSVEKPCGDANAAYCSGTVDYAEILIDVDGDKGPSVVGIDIHGFSLLNYYKFGLQYYGLYPGSLGVGYYASFNESDEEVKKRCRSNNSSSAYNLPADCTILLQRNGWKFPKDYPIKF